MGASDAPGRGVAVGGGAAHFGSPERRRRRADAADGSGRGGGDYGARAASRRLICGEEGEGVAAELGVGFDLDGEQRSVEDARRRRRRPAAACGREEGRDRSTGGFTRRTSKFLAIALRSLAALKFGLRVLFTGFGGAFLQHRHGRVLRAVGSPFDGADRSTVAYCSFATVPGSLSGRESVFL